MKPKIFVELDHFIRAIDWQIIFGFVRDQKQSI